MHAAGCWRLRGERAGAGGGPDSRMAHLTLSPYISWGLCVAGGRSLLPPPFLSSQSTPAERLDFGYWRFTQLRSHMSANESILSDIEDEQRVFIVFNENYCLHCYDGGVWNTAAQWTWHVHHSLLPHVMPRLQLFLTFSLSISSQMFFTFLFLDTIFYTSFLEIFFYT